VLFGPFISYMGKAATNLQLNINKKTWSPTKNKICQPDPKIYMFERQTKFIIKSIPIFEQPLALSLRSRELN